MSRGIGAHANKIYEDDETVIYEYGGYNLNEPGYRNEKHILDGNISVQKSCFVKPEIREKIKKMPGGRKKIVTKRVPVSVDYGRMLEEGKVKVENCSCCWKTTADDLSVDIMACSILFYIFRRYQEEGEIPEYISYNV